MTTSTTCRHCQVPIRLDITGAWADIAHVWRNCHGVLAGQRHEPPESYAVEVDGVTVALVSHS